MAGPIYVDATELRELFNAEGCWQKVKSGEWRSYVIEQNHPAPERSGQPFCTHSQLITYVDESGDEVARVHQYLRPDGTLGASGRPDPKMMFWEGRFYLVPEDKGWNG